MDHLPGDCEPCFLCHGGHFGAKMIKVKIYMAFVSLASVNCLQRETEQMPGIL